MIITDHVVFNKKLKTKLQNSSDHENKQPIVFIFTNT